MNVMKAQGTWAWELKPLLDEYVFALKGAEDARWGWKWLDALEEYAENAEELPEIAWTVLKQIAQGLPVVWDKHTKRASVLADQLQLTDRGRKAAGRAKRTEDTNTSPFEALDELAPRRKDRSQAS